MTAAYTSSKLHLHDRITTLDNITTLSMTTRPSHIRATSRAYIRARQSTIVPNFNDNTTNSTQLNSTGHVTLTAKRDQKKGKKQQLINIPYL